MTRTPPAPRDAHATHGPPGPTFRVIEGGGTRPVAWLLAVVVALVAGTLLGYGLRHSRARHNAATANLRAGNSSSSPDDDDKDDPNQVDVVYLGDAADAPEAKRPRGRASAVHPTILVKLPRFGPEQGLIPDSPAGHLLFRWLAAFNQNSADAMAAVMASPESELSTASMMQLRQQTGGYRLLSARQVAPGVLVFRLEDQTPDAGEALGTLVMRPGSDPPAVASFSLRAVEKK